MYDIASTEGNDQMKGVALIWHSYSFGLLTDSFGDVPYTEALKAEQGNTLPAYDSQADIYPALIDSLEKAVTYLNGDGEIPETQDIVYGGDASKWIKFANSLRFRMLMRISSKVDVGAELQAIVNEGMVFESNEDNAQLDYLGDNPNANPIWNTVVYTNRLEWKVNETLVTKMTELNDPRIGVFAQPNEDGIYRGVAPGIEEPTVQGYGYADVSGLGEYFLQPSTPAVFMDHAQLLFLMAEAAKKGLISGGDAAAEQYYNAGIASSFDVYNGFENEDGSVISLIPAVYLAEEGVAYDPANALEQIGTQMWLSLFAQGHEAWTEWRRTGYPTLSPAIDPIGITEIPSRYLYPADEQVLNPSNYAAAASAIGGDELTTPVWWME